MSKGEDEKAKFEYQVLLNSQKIGLFTKVFGGWCLVRQYIRGKTSGYLPRLEKQDLGD